MLLTRSIGTLCLPELGSHTYTGEGIILRLVPTAPPVSLLFVSAEAERLPEPGRFSSKLRVSEGDL